MGYNKGGRRNEARQNDPWLSRNRQETKTDMQWKAKRGREKQASRHHRMAKGLRAIRSNST
jgi:hypothetical protein